MMMFARLLKAVLSSHDTEPVMILISLYTLVWGIWLLLPMDTLAASTSYREMLRLLPELVWGTGITALGVAGLWSVAYDQQQARRLTSMGICALWVFVAVLIGIGTQWVAAAVTHFLLMAAASAWVHLRLTGQRG